MPDLYLKSTTPQIPQTFNPVVSALALSLTLPYTPLIHPFRSFQKEFSWYKSPVLTILPVPSAKAEGPSNTMTG